MNWWERVPDKEVREFYRRQDGWNKLKILREPRIRRNKFGQEVLRLSTDKGYFDISFSSPLAIALKKAGEKLNYQIAGCILEFEFDKKNKTYGEITVNKDGEVLYKRSFQRIEKASNDVEACVRALREVCENNSVYTLEALRKLLASKGYNFSDDIIFHAIKRLQEEGVFREIDQNTYWFKKDEGA